MMQRVLGHPRVSRELLALLRLGVAMDSDFPYCVELNSTALQMLLDLTDAQLAEVRHDPSKAELPEPELALALFVMRAVREPEAVAAADVQRLRDLGWDDESIFVATFQGAFMLTMGVLFTAFQMYQE
jgi:alkylhydroperoxidase family enzyme